MFNMTGRELNSKLSTAAQALVLTCWASVGAAAPITYNFAFDQFEGPSIDYDTGSTTYTQLAIDLGQPLAQVAPVVTGTIEIDEDEGDGLVEAGEILNWSITFDDIHDPITFDSAGAIGPASILNPSVLRATATELSIVDTNNGPAFRLQNQQGNVPQPFFQVSNDFLLNVQVSIPGNTPAGTVGGFATKTLASSNGQAVLATAASVSPSPVPLPAAGVMLVTGLLCMGVIRRRRRA